MERLIEGEFADCLKRNRERFNAKFARARSLVPNLDADAFSAHLREVVAPVVEAATAEKPDDADDLADTLYEVSLELLAKELVGPQSRQPLIWEGWRRTMIGLPKLLVASPRQFAGAAFNALYNLSQVPGTHPETWIDGMREAGKFCPDVPTFLAAGNVVAWRSGMPLLREKALAICGKLEPALARTALGIPESPVPVETVIEQLKADCWLLPQAIGQEGSKALRLIAVAGAFRGFGGAFASPPRVGLADGRFWVADNESCWLLIADAFGSMLQRRGTAAQMPQGEPGAAFTIGRDGHVKKGGKEGKNASFPQLLGASGFASDGTTLAVTLPLSHSIYLVAEAVESS